MFVFRSLYAFRLVVVSLGISILLATIGLIGLTFLSEPSSVHALTTNLPTVPTVPTAGSVSLTKSVFPLNAFPGEQLTYTLKVSNTTPNTYTVWVTETLPISLNLGAVIISGGTYTPTEHRLHWSGVIAPSTALLITYTTQITTAFSTEGSRITTTAEFSICESTKISSEYGR